MRRAALRSAEGWSARWLTSGVNAVANAGGCVAPLSHNIQVFSSHAIEATVDAERVAANFGAPPRLRLMERGMSYEEAAVFAATIDEGAREGVSYEVASERAQAAVSALRAASNGA